MKKQLIALLLIAVMTVSVCTAVGVTTAPRVDAKVPTKLTLSYTGRHSGSNYLFTGVLTDGSGYRLSGKLVWLQFKKAPSGPWMLWAILRTDKSGVYSAWALRRPLHIATFRGDAAYAPSESKAVFG